VTSITENAVEAIGFCFNTGHRSQWGDADRMAYLGFVFNDGSAALLSSHWSSSESFAKHDIQNKDLLSESGLTLNWLGDVGIDDPRIAKFKYQLVAAPMAETTPGETK
jgi:hypothetical protein